MRSTQFQIYLLGWSLFLPLASCWAGEDRDPRDVILRAAAVAVERGNVQEARSHLLRALWFQPFDRQVLEQVLRLERDDPDRLALWSHAYFAAACDRRGSVRLDSQALQLFDKQDRQVRHVSLERARAASEVASKLSRLSRSKNLWVEIQRRFLRDLCRDLIAESPPLQETHAAIMVSSRRNGLPPYEPVLEALVEVMAEGLLNDRPELALKAARLLQGLASQAKFKDLKGPRPPALDRELRLAREALGVARQQLAQEARVYSVEELRAMTERERLAFTRDHDSFENPGVALSPSGRYRIETTCGHGTLLGAAVSVEMHHRRLAGFFGQDPFGERQGLVRIVPDATGLEEEGGPYWWVGGFQSGDTTTVRFTAGSLAQFAPLLTHELTHRFDGRLCAGIPAWLAEGKAVFTEESFARTEDLTFLENRVDVERLETTRLKEYGTVTELRALLNGAIDDYRDNYPAGYSLYLFLRTWKDGERLLFRSALERFTQACSGGAAGAPLFEQLVCDGKEGRPSDLAQFAGLFDDFLHGFLKSGRKPFARNYQTDLLREVGLPVYDAPLWTFERKRAEPWFGQVLAARAATLLLDCERRRAAAQALLWAFEVDEWSPQRMVTLAELLEEFNEAGAGWILRSENHRRRARGAADPGPSPLLVGLPGVRAFLSRLEEAAAFYLEGGMPVTAAALASDRNRLGERLGLDPVGPGVVPPELESEVSIDRPPHSLGLLGWSEDELSDYEEFREPGLWYDTPDGHLHVGRRRPRATTGQLDRWSGRRQSFVRGNLWLSPGRHRLAMTVHFTTSYVDGALILGYTRRDRNIRFTFTGGDYDYATGKRDQAAPLDFIDCTLHGVREAETAFAGQTLKAAVRFPAPATSFRVEILIDGSTVLALVNGKEIGSYQSPDGQPIEGYVGFAVGSGAYQVELPTVEVFRRRSFGDVSESRTEGLSLSDAGPVTLSHMINRPVVGFETPQEGALLLWVPRPKQEDPAAWKDLYSKLYDAVLDLDRRLRERELSVPLLLVLPEAAEPQGAGRLRTHLREHLSRELQYLSHRKSTPLACLDDAYPVRVPMLIYVDPHGILRAMSPFAPNMAILPHDLVHWLSIHRR